MYFKQLSITDTFSKIKRKIMSIVVKFVFSPMRYADLEPNLINDCFNRTYVFPFALHHRKKITKWWACKHQRLLSGIHVVCSVQWFCQQRSDKKEQIDRPHTAGWHFALQCQLREIQGLHFTTTNMSVSDTLFKIYHSQSTSHFPFHKLCSWNTCLT
jgi:hypothetical protein